MKILYASALRAVTILCLDFRVSDTKAKFPIKNINWANDDANYEFLDEDIYLLVTPMLLAFLVANIFSRLGEYHHYEF